MSFYFTYPISLTIIFLYFFLTFFGNHYASWLFALFLGIGFGSFFLRPIRVISIQALIPDLPIFIITLIFIGSLAFITSPLISTKRIGSFTHLQVTSPIIGDYYKHTFVVNALRLHGIPPKDPYFPKADLSYYYGYYLIPAAFAKLFNFYPNITFYYYFLLTDTLVILIITKIIKDNLKKYWSRILALILFLSAAGFDIFASTLSFFLSTQVLEKFGLFNLNLGIQLNNNLTAFLFAPQHIFASAYAIGIIYYLLTEKPKVLFLTTSIAVLFLSSIFVSLLFVFWAILIIIFYRDKRKLLIISGFIALILLTPYFQYLSNRQNPIYFQIFQPFAFIANIPFSNIINIFLTFLFEYGPLSSILLIVTLINLKNFDKKRILYFIALVIPFLVTLLFRTRRYNDFSIRTSIPIQFIFPVFWLVYLENIKNNIFKILLIILSILTITLGIFSAGKQFSEIWKTRKYLHPKESELLLKVRNLPVKNTLAAIDRDKWVELIPSLGFHDINSPFMFDSFDYFSSPLRKEHDYYGQKAVQLFIDADTNKNVDSLIQDKNNQYKFLFDFFKFFKSDNLIVNNKLWVKNDINPWLIIFKSLGVESTELTYFYTSFNYQDLLNKLAQKKVKIFPEKAVTLQIKERKVDFPKGLWYVISCTDKPTKIYLEFEDYYQIFNEILGENNKNCAGRLFYLPKEENLVVSNQTTIDSFQAVPLDIN